MASEKVAKKVTAAAALRKLQELPDDFLDCRDMLHAWSRTKSYVPLGRNEKHPSELLRETVCIRCGTVKRDVYSARTLERQSTTYVHPAGYIIKGGDTFRKRRGVLTRRAVIERSLARQRKRK